MKEPKDLRPGDKCYLVDRDFSLRILEIEKIEGKESHWISFKEPVRGEFIPPDVKTFVNVFLGKKLFFDKERALKYMSEKIKKIQRDISKIEKT